jgi:hypothetical protein
MDQRYDLQSSGVGGPGFGGAGFGFGGGGIGGFGLFGLIGLLGRRGLGGDEGGGEGCCARVVWEAAVQNKLGTIEAAIPMSTAAINANTTASATSIKDTLQNQNLWLQSQLSQFAMGVQNGFTNTGDKIQLGIAASAAQANETQNLINQTTCAIKSAIAADGDQTRALINAIDRDRLRDELDQMRHAHRTAEANITMTQVVNQSNSQMQQQQQQQQQQQVLFDLSRRFDCFSSHVGQFMAQSNRSSASPVNLGSGTQIANPNQQSNNLGSQGF